ncbi:hypothetical protein [Reinekea sp.]|jgi:MSHA biogenesis protein MshI|uniref:type IV pilus biogenesis protein PilM n=1 Tax=Reinekea sp. TaxID=1970455 RepID=UPI002A800A7C|nr:hypothetical protein [Reinekea sp.]
MSTSTTYLHKTQQWLYIAPEGLAVLETGMAKDGMPYLAIKASQPSTNPLDRSEEYAQWVKQQVTGNINILLADGLHQVLLSDVPDVPEAEMDAAIELKAGDLLSYDLDDALLDTIHLPKEAYRGRLRMAFIVAAKKNPLRLWLMALIRLGIRVDIIDVETTQLRNLALMKRKFNESGIFHLKPDNSRLVLNYGQEMVLSRTFDIGLSSLSSETTVQDGELELTVTEDTQAVIQLETLVLEIRRSLDYYEAQLGLGSIAEIQFLCDPLQHQFAEQLADKLGVRFEQLDPSDFMRIQVVDPDDDPVTYYGLAGTAYREIAQ